MDTVFIYDFSNVLLCAEGIHREERVKIDSAKLREARTSLRSDGSYVRYFEAVREAIRGKYPNARTASHVLVMPRSTSSDFYSSVAKDLNRKGFVVFSHAKANLDDEIMEFARKSPCGGISIVSNDWDFQGSWWAKGKRISLIRTVTSEEVFGARFPTVRIDSIPPITKAFSERFAVSVGKDPSV